MTYQERQGLIRRLEAARESRVLAYVLSDRESFPPMPGNPIMTGEAQPIFAKLLRGIGRVERLDLLLYTRGGVTESVWPLANLLREHCAHLGILVPFRAHSAGTMLCLAADEIVMCSLGELSPIDATTGNQFNPRDPANPAQPLGISVEDVRAFFDLARDVADVKSEAGLLEVFRMLASAVPPLALGNVERVYLLIRRLAFSLLELHLDSEQVDFNSIVEGLTREFNSHLHAVSRREAQRLMGDWVVAPKDGISEAIDALFDAYASDLSLFSKYFLAVEMGDRNPITVRQTTGFLESNSESYRYEIDLGVRQRPIVPPGPQLPGPAGHITGPEDWPGRQFDFGIHSMGWRDNEGGH
ncbi:MAG: hypothetical protein M0027_10440 [Candidatus Dormibacteraeota bacterium]|jgi:hypothetical protein|nr:hypothetical protein [Candidatus Dormibacteraeota bacterium]